MFTQGNTYGTGRPKGALNKAPKRDQICELLNTILDEFINDYDTLTKEDKLQILRAFRHLWRHEQSEPITIQDNEIKVRIIQPNNYERTLF
jgi:hypothetical protein